MNNNKIYLAADGDDVGNIIEYHMLRNDLPSLGAFSSKFTRELNKLCDKLCQTLDAEVIFCGGDNLLISFDFASLDHDVLELIRQDFAKYALTTITFGLGTTPRNALIALNFAKVSGKNKLEFFSNLPEQPIITQETGD